jgi:hypothetical protein
VKAEPAKLPGAGIWPEAVPRKMRGRKGVLTEISEESASEADLS